MSNEFEAELDQLPIWVRRLYSDDEAQRVYAAMRLTSLGVDLTPVVPQLQEALQDSDAQIRKLAAYVLAHVGRARDAA